MVQQGSPVVVVRYVAIRFCCGFTEEMSLWQYSAT